MRNFLDPAKRWGRLRGSSSPLFNGWPNIYPEQNRPGHKATTDLHLMQWLRNSFRLYIQSTICFHGMHMDNTPFALCGLCPLQLVQCCGTQYSVCCENHKKRTDTQSDKMNVAARGAYNYQRDENTNFMQTLEFTTKIHLYYLWGFGSSFTENEYHLHSTHHSASERNKRCLCC